MRAKTCCFHAVFLAAFILLFGSTPARTQESEPKDFIENPPASAAATLVDIVFTATLPNSVFRTVTAPSGGADVDIFARDCCIRDDVVEIYVDGCRLAVIDSRGGANGTHPGETHTVSVNAGAHTVEYRNVVSGVGPSGWQVSETVKPFTGNFFCCEGGGGSTTTEPLSDFPSCGPAAKLSPKWGQFGKKAVLEADSGDKLELECKAAGVNYYALFFTPKGGSPVRVGICPFEAGCNSPSFSHTGDKNNNGKPDCLVRTRWLSRDHGNNDNPNPWTGEASENKLDYAESVFEVKTKDLTKTDYKYNYLVGPPLHLAPSAGHTSGCPHVPNAQGTLASTTIVDPPVGPETEAFFDEVVAALGELEPGDAMAGDFSPPCDLDNDGDCDAADFQVFQSAIGACRGDGTYLSSADADADGCVTSSDQSALFGLLIDIKPGSHPNTVNPKSQGVIPVAIVTYPFSTAAANVDASTFRFGSTGKEAAPVHSALEDADGDGDLDLVLHFRTQETGIACGETSAYLQGKTLGGEVVRGADSVRTVGCQPK